MVIWLPQRDIAYLGAVRRFACYRTRKGVIPNRHENGHYFSKFWHVFSKNLVRFSKKFGIIFQNFGTFFQKKFGINFHFFFGICGYLS